MQEITKQAEEVGQKPVKYISEVEKFALLACKTNFFSVSNILYLIGVQCKPNFIFVSIFYILSFLPMVFVYSVGK